MKTVIVTGSNGFIGSYVCQEYSNNGWKVIGVDRPTSHNFFAAIKHYEFVPMDLPDPMFIKVVETSQPDLLIHAAGLASVPYSVANPLGDFIGSVQLYFFVLDAIRKACPTCKAVLLSSAAVFGNPAALPIDEECAKRPISPYGYHKMLCEEINAEFNHLFGAKVCSARIFSAYGPGLRKQVLWDICNKVISDPLVQLDGSGAESRDFIHVKDIAGAIYILGEKGAFDAEVYNIASGIETSIRQLAEKIISAFGCEKELRFTGIARSGDPNRWRANIRKIEQLGFSPKISLVDGIKDYVTWYENEIKNK